MLSRSGPRGPLGRLLRPSGAAHGRLWWVCLGGEGGGWLAPRKSHPRQGAVAHRPRWALRAAGPGPRCAPRPSGPGLPPLGRCGGRRHCCLRRRRSGYPWGGGGVWVLSAWGGGGSLSCTSSSLQRLLRCPSPPRASTTNFWSFTGNKFGWIWLLKNGGEVVVGVWRRGGGGGAFACNEIGTCNGKQESCPTPPCITTSN